MAAVNGARLTVTAGLCSVGAAAIHAAVALPHFDASAILGLLFVVAALGQALWAALFLARPSTRLLAGGVAGNLAILTGWIASRTVGLPFGPHAWAPEPVEALDMIASTLELTVVAACLTLARIGLYRPPTRARLFATVSAAAVAALAAAAVLAAPSGAGSHHAPAEPAHTHSHDPADTHSHDH